MEGLLMIKNIILSFAVSAVFLASSRAAEQNPANPQADKIVEEIIAKLQSKQTKEEDKIRLVAALGELGPDHPASGRGGQDREKKSDFYRVLALIGPKAVPALRQEAHAIVANGVKSKADANNLRRLGDMVGPEIGDAIEAVIPEQYNEETWADDRYWIHYRGGWYPLAHAFSYRGREYEGWQLGLESRVGRVKVLDLKVKAAQ
jgi:hypothetical protein